MELEEYKIAKQKQTTKKKLMKDRSGFSLKIANTKIKKREFSLISNKDSVSLEKDSNNEITLRPLLLRSLKPKKLNVKSEISELSLAPIKLLIRHNTGTYNNSEIEQVIKPHAKQLNLRELNAQNKGIKKEGQIKIKLTPKPPKKVKLKPIEATVVPVKLEDEESTAEANKSEMLEGYDFIEFLLGKGGRKILSGKPLCIIVEKHKDDYEWLVAAICREIYREIKGGYPQPLITKHVEDIEFNEANISNQIIITEKARYSETLRKILLKFPFSDLGYLILVSEKPIELEEKILRNVSTIEEYLVRIEPVKLDDDVKIRVLEHIAGSKLPVKVTFGKDFIKSIEKFSNSLEKYLDFNKVPSELGLEWNKLMAKSPENSEEASNEHSAMKAFTWIYLWKKHNITPELESYEGVDVKLNDECYEIETFYKRNPIGVLTEKVEKLRGKKIIFVLRNISILIHLKDLITFINIQRKSNTNVKILGIDFDREEFIPIEKFVKEVSKWKK